MATEPVFADPKWSKDCVEDSASDILNHVATALRECGVEFELRGGAFRWLGIGDEPALCLGMVDDGVLWWNVVQNGEMVEDGEIVEGSVKAVVEWVVEWVVEGARLVRSCAARVRVLSNTRTPRDLIEKRRIHAIGSTAASTAASTVLLESAHRAAGWLARARTVGWSEAGIGRNWSKAARASG